MCTHGVCIGFFFFLSIHLQEVPSKVSKVKSHPFSVMSSPPKLTSKAGWVSRYSLFSNKETGDRHGIKFPLKYLWYN